MRTAINLRERAAMVVTARSPIERLVAYEKQRGFTNLPFVSDLSGGYNWHPQLDYRHGADQI
jgi:predicted dithiol-disulfide oxidoreductase (DUF899 family)